LKVRSVAKLKTYRRTKSKPSIVINKELGRNEIAQPVNHIVINDSIVYESANQFRLTKAMQLYNESVLIASELFTDEKTLNEARTNYEKAENNERKRIKAEIKLLENKVLILKNEAASKKKQAINEEIKFIFKY
jgi:hypothetical protein